MAKRVGGKQFKTGRDMTCTSAAPDIDYAKTSEAPRRVANMYERWGVSATDEGDHELSRGAIRAKLNECDRSGTCRCIFFLLSRSGQPSPRRPEPNRTGFSPPDFDVDFAP